MSDDDRDAAGPPTPAAEENRTPRNRWTTVWLVIAVVGLVAVSTVTAVAVSGMPVSQPSPTPSAGPTSTARPTPWSPDRSPTPEPSTPPVTPSPPPTPPPPVVPPDPDAAVLPGDCSGLYSDSMYTYLSVDEELPLNDGTTLEPPFSKAETVAAHQIGLPGLVCTWGSAGHFGLLTQANEVTKAQSASALGALRAAGYTCYEQALGTRCTMKSVGDGEAWGESHFLRGNIWLCTFWSNFTPTGYTADMVATLWG